MENINSIQHKEVKTILENKNPSEFDIKKFIEEINQVKNKHKTTLTWSHDEWDNWYGN
jgi:hypothetical protein